MIVLNIIFLILNGFFFYSTYKMKVEKAEEQQKYIDGLKQDIIDLHDTKSKISDQILESLNKKSEIEEQLVDWKEIQLKAKKQEIDLMVQQRERLANQTIIKINQQLETHKQAVAAQKHQLQTEIDKIKSSLNAGIEARLREQQKQEKLEFYKLNVSQEDLEDIKKLETLKLSFNNPVILSKLIWTQYFQKQMTALCDRILGKNTICGIYKLTNLITQECYIGQSVDCSQRWKDHCKKGLGINAPSTNVLYKSMKDSGVWNFTFELLEECPRQQLNEKEAMWIDMYQSNITGLNSTKGNLK